MAVLIKQALRNVHRQLANYFIYFITVAGTVAMLFAVVNVIFSKNMSQMIMAASLRQALIGVVVFICMVVAFVLSYATAFMLRLRLREFGTYLTLGMTHKNLLTIFVAETTAICLLALAVGIALGLFVYQGLMALMMQLMDMHFTLAAYSAKGLALTVGLVAGLFALGLVCCAIYLNRVSIYNLLYGADRVQKRVKHPWLWGAVALVCVMVGTISVIMLDKDLINTVKTGQTTCMLQCTGAFFVAVFLLHVALAKGSVYLLLKNRWLRSTGTATFVLRQLSGTLNSNGVMLGFLAVLLTLTVVGVNLSFLQRAGQQEMLNNAYPYDILYRGDVISSDSAAIPPTQAEPIISQYVSIVSRTQYCIYTTGDRQFLNHAYPDQTMGDTDMFMSLSDFNALITPLGYPPVTLDNQYLVVANQPTAANNWPGFVYHWGSQSYTLCRVAQNYPTLCYGAFYVVLPDSAIQGMQPLYQCITYRTTGNSYNAAQLEQALSYPTTINYNGQFVQSQRCDYSLREYGRQSQNSSNAILAVGTLFAAIIFLLMAMAILALKTLSTLPQDQTRYQILHRLGANSAQQGRALFWQAFYFFALPFALPLLISIPTAVVYRHIVVLAGLPQLATQVPAVAAAIAAGMAAVHLLYYVATYLIAKRTVIISN